MSGLFSLFGTDLPIEKSECTNSIKNHLTYTIHKRNCKLLFDSYRWFWNNIYINTLKWELHTCPSHIHKILKIWKRISIKCNMRTISVVALPLMTVLNICFKSFWDILVITVQPVTTLAPFILSDSLVRTTCRTRAPCKPGSFFLLFQLLVMIGDIYSLSWK